MFFVCVQSITCFCGEAEKGLMVGCNTVSPGCYEWYHSACVGIADESSTPTDFSCPFCAAVQVVVLVLRVASPVCLSVCLSVCVPVCLSVACERCLVPPLRFSNAFSFRRARSRRSQASLSVWVTRRPRARSPASARLPPAAPLPPKSGRA